MYYAHSIREVDRSPGSSPLFHVWRFVVTVDHSGRPEWKLESAWGGYNSRARARKAARNVHPELPILPNLTIGKRVTKGEAAKLLHMTLGAAALDRLQEEPKDDHPGVSNPPKPPRAVKPKVQKTAAEIAEAEAARCNAKAEEFRRKIARAQTRLAKWTRRAAHYTRKAAKLREGQSQ